MEHHEFSLYPAISGTSSQDNGKASLSLCTLLASLGGKESNCQYRRCKRCRFDPWVGKIPWSRKWQTTPVFLPGKSHGQRSLAGYSPWGHKESDTSEASTCTLLCSLYAKLGMLQNSKQDRQKNCIEGLLCSKLWTTAPIHSEHLLNTQVHRAPPQVKTWVNTCFFKNHLHPALLRQHCVCPKANASTGCHVI